MADREEEIRIKNQKAAEAMQRARKIQMANEKMQRELQAAARELARHQEMAKKAALQQAAAQEAAVSRQNVAKDHRDTNPEKPDVALKQQDASREAARQAMIYEAAKRRAEKKEAAKKAAELIAAQKAAEKKVHHTSPETKELQNLLLKQIADIMEEKEPDAGKSPVQASDQKNKEPKQGSEETAKTDPIPKEAENFGDLVIMDIHGERLQPESSAALEKKAEEQQKAREREAEREAQTEAKLETWGRMGSWFQTFCWMHIPIIGFWYMLVLALRKKTPKEKKAFARAYVLYRILVLILACTILYIFYQMGLSFVEQILSYIEAHQ